MRKFLIFVVICCIINITPVSAESSNFRFVNWDFLIAHTSFNHFVLPKCSQYLSKENTLFVPLRVFCNAMLFKVIGYSDSKIELSDIRTDEIWHTSDYYNIETGENFKDYDLQPSEIIARTQDDDYYKYYGLDNQIAPIEYYECCFGFKMKETFEKICNDFSTPQTVMKQLFQKFPDLKNGNVSAYYDVFNEGLIVMFSQDKTSEVRYFNYDTEVMYYVDFSTGNVVRYSNPCDDTMNWNSTLESTDKTAEIRKLNLSIDEKKEIVIDSVLINGSNYVPVRVLSEFFGYVVHYIPKDPNNPSKSSIHLYDTNGKVAGSKEVGIYGEFKPAWNNP